MRRASRFSRAVSRAAVVFGAAAVGTGCRDDDSVEGYATTQAYQVLNVTRELDAPAPVVQVELEVSPFALEHILVLHLTVHVESGQTLERQGVSAHWFGDVATPDLQADFVGALSNSAELRFGFAASPCEAAPCVVTLELSPRGDWTSDVPFPVEYVVDARLALDHAGDRGALASDLTIGLQVVP